MKTALIGWTGFVGGNLLEQAPWDDRFRGADIHTLAGRRYDLVVCAGAPAAKWQINQNPQADAANLATLQAALDQAEIGELVLVSTIDVYNPPLLVDESSPIHVEGHHAYGLHRLQLEHWCQARHPTRVLRLPGLFGKGLKKNVIFDLLHDNQVDRIDPDGEFQYYDLRHLWHDIQKMRALDLRLLNVATAPIRTQRIATELFGRTLPERPGPHARYDMHSLHAAAWQGRDGYLYDEAQVWSDLQAFVAGARA